MSIDAVVKKVVINENGSGELRLIDRPARKGENDGIAGQHLLTFGASYEEVCLLKWLPIWGNNDQIILGDKKIANRIGYTTIQFVDRENFIQAVNDYKSKMV